MIFALLLFVLGVVASGLFSGAETGFYQVSRVRLVLDALSGSWISRSLLWLTNRPSVFIATTLVGNNLANYLVSLAVVVGTHQLFTSTSHWLELAAPIAVAPVVFVLGELMPKHVFYEAPNRMLRRYGPLLVACTWLFLPISSLLWGLNRLLHRLIGTAPQQVRLVVARKELEDMLREGHEAGILRPAQRILAQGLFAVASRNVREFATPVGRVPRVWAGMSKAEIVQVARRQRLVAVPVEESPSSRRLIGYLRVADLCLMDGDDLPALQTLVDIPETDSYIAALTRMVRSGEMLGRVASTQGRTIGFISTRELSEALFRAR